MERKRGSIALARSLCYEINGAADDSDDFEGGGYGSVDIAEILSAEVVRLQAALAQPAQRPLVDLTDADWKEIEDMPDAFDQGVAWCLATLKRKNT